MARRKSPIQRHHIRYGNEGVTEWIMPLRMWMHRAVTLLARMNPTPENYAQAINFQHSINQVVNDMRCALDNGDKKHHSQKASTK